MAQAQPKIFQHEDGEAIRFHIVPGPTYVTKTGGIDENNLVYLTGVIEEHGGEVVEDLDAAEVWVVSNYGMWKYTRYCGNDPDHRVVNENFIEDCLKKRAYLQERPPMKAMMRGRYPGKRSRFTKEDEGLLCRWIAYKAPERESCGRFGTSIWRKLGEAGNEFSNSEAKWAGAERHPPSSWKEHYKKNQARLDPIIDKIVARLDRKARSRVVYEADRRINNGRLRTRRTEEAEGGQGEGEGGEDDDEYADVDDSRLEQEKMSDGEEFHISSGDDFEDEDLLDELAAPSQSPARDARRQRMQAYILLPERRYTRPEHLGPGDAEPSGVNGRSPSAAPGSLGRPSPSRASSFFGFSQQTLVNPSPSKIVQTYSQKRTRSADNSPAKSSPRTQLKAEGESPSLWARAKRRRVEKRNLEHSWSNGSDVESRWGADFDNPFAAPSDDTD